MGSFTVTGGLVFKGETEKKTETFSIREFVVEEAGERFSQFIKFQLSNDKCALIDSAKLGDTIEVAFNLQGRKHEKDGKISFFNTLGAWKITIVSAAPTTTAPIYTPPTEPTKEGKNNLPF